ncbi:OmpA family protein [Persicobacter diffluens]|uniref:OmpA-like domain-containing protein n=1 Tax=Persicobacter diffluens TaxID=981 RepID=A0AAN5AJB2_9BACT|nr:hypothetical protein PEDI_13410 [Persicobacter diffluens]
MIRKIFAIITLMLFGGINLYAQGHQGFSTSSKKAIKLYDQATVLLKARQFPEAERKLFDALKKDPDFIEAHLRLASIYSLYRKPQYEKEHLEKVATIANGNPKYAKVYGKLAGVYFNEGRYDDALAMGKMHMQARPPEREAKQTEWVMECAAYAKELMSEPVPFVPKEMDANVNQFALQYFPVVTVDEKTLIFTRRVGNGRTDTEDIVICNRREDGSWSDPVSISDRINTEMNEGTCTISSDGKMLIFTSCSGERKSFGSCDLYVTYKVGEEWSEPENLGKTVNSSAWESQPALSADGRELYFVSDRRGGFGKRDLFVTYRTPKGIWTPATNLGKEINTNGDEVGPFIHVNGQRLYFSSNGHKGMGGYDFFYSDRKSDGTWGEVKNLGYPINDHKDQSSLVVNATGTTGYISIDDLHGEQPESKLYTFDIPEDQRIPNRSSYVAGTVFDLDTKQPLDAKVELYNVANNTMINTVVSDPENGGYQIVLTEGEQYALFVSRKGYLYKSIPFDYKRVEGETPKPVHQDIYLEPIRTGTVTRLENVFFDSDSYQLREESKSELMKAVKFLEENPKLVMEISGHTDDVGNASYNKELSKNRAKAVYEFMVSENIDANRLRYKGYGMDQPVVDNDSDANRQKNRRIEFKVIGDQYN